MPVQQPFKLASREVRQTPSEVRIDARHRGWRAHRRDGGAVLGGVRVPDARGGGRGESGGGAHPARRGVQAAHLALRLPGIEGAGAPVPRRGPQADRACPWSPRCSRPRASSWSPSTPTCSRSARAISRTSRLLRRVGEMGKPVLLKRGMATTIQEFLLSAEYILAAGNPNVILCERGIRTFETTTRFTLDLNAVPVLKKLSHLPVVVDPVARHRALGSRGAHGQGGRRVRRGRAHHRGAPAPRGGAVRRPAVPQADEVRPAHARAQARGRGGRPVALIA